MVKHSGIRVALLMLLAGLLPTASLNALTIAGGSVCLLVFSSPLSASVIFRGLLRLKWLFISIAILYLWYTPGPAPLAPHWLTIPINLPSYLGIELALERSLVLAVLYAAVMICLFPMSPAQIVTGLAWVLAPLALCRVPVALFSQRLGETLIAVREIQATLSTESTSTEVSTARAWLTGIADRGASAIQQVESGLSERGEPSKGDSLQELSAHDLTLRDGAIAVAAALGMIAVVVCV